MSDSLYKSPSDKMVKMMVENNVPTYSYVLNTTIEALNYPFWSRVPHNIEYYFLTGAPFMDPGNVKHMCIAYHVWLLRNWSTPPIPLPEFYAEDLRVDRKQWNEDDRRMSEFFLKALANFARYGYVRRSHETLR